MRPSISCGGLDTPSHGAAPSGRPSPDSGLSSVVNRPQRGIARRLKKLYLRQGSGGDAAGGGGNGGIGRFRAADHADLWEDGSGLDARDMDATLSTMELEHVREVANEEATVSRGGATPLRAVKWQGTEAEAPAKPDDGMERHTCLHIHYDYQHVVGNMTEQGWTLFCSVLN